MYQKFDFTYIPNFQVSRVVIKKFVWKVNTPFNLRKIYIKKISYEQRDYESRIRKEPILGYVPKTMKNIIQAVKGWRNKKFTNLFNHLLPSVPHMTRLVRILILILQGIIEKKNSYERRDYESVDETSLS